LLTIINGAAPQTLSLVILFTTTIIIITVNPYHHHYYFQILITLHFTCFLRLPLDSVILNAELLEDNEGRWFCNSASENRHKLISRAQSASNWRHKWYDM